MLCVDLTWASTRVSSCANSLILRSWSDWNISFASFAISNRGGFTRNRSLCESLKEIAVNRTCRPIELGGWEHFTAPAGGYKR
jgi:hypothetical protein